MSRRLHTQLALYRCTLRLLPKRLRVHFASEMLQVMEDRLRERPAWTSLLAECVNVMVTAAHAHLQQQSMHVPAAVTAVLLLFLLRGGGPVDPARPRVAAPDSVDFMATDPAGEFTLTVRNGRAVAASIDRRPVDRRQLIHAGDSIRVLGSRGQVLFAVAYNRSKATIEWTARPAGCRGRAFDCEVY